ncbi:helix-turn-helix transcriptional regulator [Tsukamurella sputi]|uniref:Helix-turn-helix transcriptional regulator n=1 Tax=Tsukamurella sputi TaxID=2591848 RepID=A0A5C5RLZ7_9ACTN|nr:helix-turn-helix transcriptional regulator [Tsukamurella sputi]TWS23634.1 helix-turn-helix transcriptional regulator [Tsukamurella sputi]
MIASLTAERVRGDVEVLSRAGLGIDDFLSEAVTAVRRAVPWVGACVGTHDPASLMLTSARKYGSLVANHDHDMLWGTLEYGAAESTSFRSLAFENVRAVSMLQLPREVIASSPRMNRLMRPVYGFADEARLVFRDSAGVWGCLAVFRGGAARFSDDDVDFLGSLSESFARGVRGGILTRLGAGTGEDLSNNGPAVVMVDSAGEISQISRGAEALLRTLATTVHDGDPRGLVIGLAAAARRAGDTSGAPLPRARVRTPSGHWLVLHASPMDCRDGATGDVVVTIEEARPPEIVALVVAAFGLTQRERDVTRMVLQGCDTKEIAAALHLSGYTVQDHLKSVFAKAGVRSRRELIARIYFDQYVPRMGAETMPNGFFAPAVEAAP